MRLLDLIEALPSHVRGAGFEFDTDSRELHLTVSKTRTDVYRLKILPWTPEPGLAVRLDKITEGSDPEGDGYTVFVCDRPGRDSCECKGFLYGRGRACKHIAAVRGLRSNRWIG
jgi:hypothetical protein